MRRGLFVVPANQNEGGPLPQAFADWSSSEKSELRRLQAAYPPPHYEMESGATEDGDPWWVVCDRALDQVVVHIARIGRRYLIVHPEKNINKTVAQIKIAIDLLTQ